MPKSPRRGALFRACPVALVLAALGISCAPSAARGRGTAGLLEEARAEGLALEDPLAIDEEMTAAVERAISRTLAPEVRLRMLRDFVRYHLRFAYVPNRSLTARPAWRARGGDCVAYTNLFVALARQSEA
jgi:Transglutaminase-like superfamily